MNKKHYSGRLHALISCLLAVTMIIGLFPAFTAQAAQEGAYYDPAEHWQSAGNRVDELDMNAIVTDEIMNCAVCGKPTLVHVFRVPEYTRSGQTALNHGVLYSDGTMIDGVNHGNVDAGVPGVNATYTGYHWTKNVCTVCGTVNCLVQNDYGFGKNVYNLYDCAAGFEVPFSKSTVTPYNSQYHTVTTKAGEYCQFCFGTHATTTSQLVPHNFEQQIDPQIGNNRFVVCSTCKDCGYDTDAVITAKTVIASYYGMAD